MNLLKYLFVFLLLPFFSYAENPDGMAIEDKVIQGVNVNLGGGFYFSTTDETENPDNCKRTNWYRLAAKEYEKEAFLLISSAYNNKQSVSFFIDGCYGDYPKVEYVYVGKFQ